MKYKIMIFIAGWIMMTGDVLAQVVGEDIPVAPISACTSEGWTNAYVLKNDRLELAAVPETGRLSLLTVDGGENVLRSDKSLRDVLPPKDDTGEWYNYGGDWIWPVAQKKWPLFQEGEWPPSRLIDGRAWEGRAWKCSDGTQCCLLQQEYGAPLYIKVSRLFKLPKEGHFFTIHQQIQRTAASDIPVVLWNISQMNDPSYIVFPMSDSEHFDGTYHLMMGSQPETNALLACTDDVFVFNCAGASENKLGVRATPPWIASVRGKTILLQRADDKSDGSNYPDGGCNVEMYANRGMKYAEIEHLSSEMLLAEGETMENDLTFVLATLDAAPATPRDAAQKVRSMVP